jgi:hypothetical protein
MGTKKPKPGEATIRDALAYVPSKIHADPRRNYSRRELFPTPDELKPYLGDVCNFTLAQIERRLASFKKNRQISAANIYLTSVGRACLVRGYLRHAAFCLAEARGELDQIPGSGGKILCTLVPEPKSEADWLGLAESNHAENTDIEPLTPINKARYAEWLTMPTNEGGGGLTQEQALPRLGLTNKRQLDRYLRLLKLPPDVRADVHFGKRTMSQALASSTASGEAGSPGERAGVKTKRTREAVAYKATRKPPTKGLNRDEMELFAELYSGARTMDEADMPENVRAWFTWCSPTSDEIKAIKAATSPSKKLAAVKPGESVPTAEASA